MSKTYFLIVVFVCTCFFGICNRTVGQEDDDETVLPRIVRPTLLPGLHVPDAGPVSNKSRYRMTAGVVRDSSRQVANRIVSKLVTDRKTTFQIVHEKLPVVITVHDGGAIDVTKAWFVEAANIEEYAQFHPKSAKRIGAILQSEFPGSKIKRVEVETKYSAMHADQLRRLYPMVFEVYQQYIK